MQPSLFADWREQVALRPEARKTLQAFEHFPKQSDEDRALQQAVRDCIALSAEGRVVDARWAASSAPGIAELKKQCAKSSRHEGPTGFGVPKVSAGLQFGAWIYDSGEGPPALCTIAALYIAHGRWVVVWASGEAVGYHYLDELSLDNFAAARWR